MRENNADLIKNVRTYVLKQYPVYYLKFCLDLYVYILLIQILHSTSVIVRLSYQFRSLLLWMLSSLLMLTFIRLEISKLIKLQ